jgi:ribosomal protein S18 acetylase RimI-like enzyme
MGGAVTDIDRRMLDELATNATPAPLTRLIDGWLCKHAPDLPFRRANCALPRLGAGDDVARAEIVVDELERIGWEHNRRVLIQVSEADPTSPPLDAHLQDRGYEIEAPVDVLVASTEDLRRQPVTAWISGGLGPERNANGTLPTAEHIRSLDAVHGADERWRGRTVAYGRMLASLGEAAVLGRVTVGADEQPVALGFAVAERGWVGIFGMGTADGWRRRGAATGLLELFSWSIGGREAPRSLYLQVEVDNAPAQALYRSLGFVRSHGYHYRAKEPS